MLLGLTSSEVLKANAVTGCRLARVISSAGYRVLVTVTSVFVLHRAVRLVG